MRLLVAGGSVAGAAGALRASARGVDVVWVRGGAGASTLSPGVADLAPYRTAPETEPLSQALSEFVRALGAWQVGDRSATVVSAFGVVRRARARDPLVFDLESIAGRVLGVPAALADVDLATSIGESEWLRRTRTTVQAVAVRPPRWAGTPAHTGSVVADAFPEELRRVANALAASQAPPDAWLLPPSWLPDESVRDRLASSLARPVGCAMGSLGGGLGERLARRLERFEPAGVRSAWGWIRRVERRAGALSVELSTPTGERSEFTADHVLLCIGGLVGGGIRLAAGGRLELDVALPRAELELWAEGGARTLDSASASGVDFAELGHEALARIGVRSTPGSLPDGIHVAGDVASRVPRTLLGAAQSAIDVVDALG